MTTPFSNHPCFDDSARHRYGRVHLPIAPQCNMQCKYCNRDYDCPNENRPGVASRILAPEQALVYLKKVMEKRPDISVVGIAGPGDAFANPKETLRALQLIRSEFPDILICIATNGLNLLPFIDPLAECKVSHVTVTVNAVDPQIGAQIYSWIRSGTRVFRGAAAADLLLERQLQSIALLKQNGILVKINTILLPGINSHHIKKVAQTVREAGAEILNCIPLYPVSDSEFGNHPQPTAEMVVEARRSAAPYLPQMSHCVRCRADAVGLLAEDARTDLQELLRECAQTPPPDENRPYVAVASREGILVNQHLGHAEELWIYAPRNERFQLVEKRPTPSTGGGNNRWFQLSTLVKDCRALMVNAIGRTPESILRESGIQVVQMDGFIEDGLHSVYAGLEIRPPVRSPSGCGCGYKGNGTGCS